MAARGLTMRRAAMRRGDETGRGTIGGYDERCAADLATVGEGRALSREDRAWLARVVTGAVRPNRDKPLWDLAHALAALALLTGARDGRDLVTLVLDPGLARPGAIEARFGASAAGAAAADARGLVLGGARGWRGGWGGLARLLALGEFLLAAEDLAHFAALADWLDELARAPDADAAAVLAKRLARRLAAYRGAHMPLAAHERRFRAILAHLAGRTAFDDDDVLAVWQAEMRAGERPGFRTVAEHFVTFEAAAAVLRDLGGLNAAAPLDAAADWDGRLDADRLDAALADLAADDPPAPLADLLAGFPEGPKILTGAERDDLADLLRLDPFHRTRPLTALRAASFGRVQSGIANRLRRGGGGAGVAERAACAEAESYAALAARARDLAGHLGRMLRIAAALRLAGGAADLPAAARAALAAAEADLRRVRRAGFDDRARLEAGFAAAQDALLRLSAEADRLDRALAALDRQRPLDAAFAADRAAFAAVLTAAYAADAAASPAVVS
ncbi:hypothetical protein Q8W71_09660 [Methylobacterium sp. NEAU 140]|uniref:hypothetical protein n=1 Tax=Methylobacterium sp. NEAU 140 TaxID=3064945 RepID=UPI002733DD0A|nr:hypothetical protein [Methylobacterium sp. NEAU 140]MDP4022887.1 hypothetical protein [Methylobacterium sp. NEAU 140]